jgi:xanthine dehydrogenase large subunit
MGSSGEPLPHESAALHVSGEALYTDDVPLPASALHAAFGTSSIAHGRVRRVDLDAVRTAPGVVAVLTAADIPGANNYGPVVADDPILARDLVQYVGQPLFLVVARSSSPCGSPRWIVTDGITKLPAAIASATSMIAGSGS